MTSPRILISGAGIAGLSLARRLDGKGIDFTILEERAESSHSSAGIALPYNAVQALRELGLGERVLEVAHQVQEVLYTKKNGKILGRADLNAAPLNQDKFVAMGRTDLHKILLEGIESRIHFEASITAFERKPDGVTVTCTNPELNGHYDLVVSAEGINSELRKKCFPEEITIADHKVSNWRFAVKYPNHGLEPVYMFDRTELFMAYPMGPDLLYCYGHVYEESDERYREGSQHDHLRKLFGGFGGEVPNILDRLGDQPVFYSRLKSVSKPYYSSGRIVFVGDAGNACSPLLQQGAASAFEDVICLAEQLKQNDSIDKAISEYQRIRAPRVEWVVKTSDGPFKALKAMRSPIGAFIRNMVIRMKGPLNANGWRQLASK